MLTQADVRRRIRLWEILRASRARTNPAPGRQVVTREGEDEYGLPIGATIPPGGRKLGAVQQAGLRALTPEQRTRYLGERKVGATHAEALKLASGGPVGKPAAPKAPAARPRKAAAKADRPPAKPVDIHKLFDADDATIEAALRDVWEGQFGPYTTKVTHVGIVRAGTRTDSRGRVREVTPDIGVDGRIYTTYRDYRGEVREMEIGHFSRSISPVVYHYADGRVRREVWAYHGVVELGGGTDENGREDTKYHGKGFGGAFSRRAIEWYRASGIHGIGLSDHNGYVWASQGFNFSGGVMPDYKIEQLQELIAALRAGRTKNQYGETIPKALRTAPDLAAQIEAAEALLARVRSTKPGEPGYPTAYEVSQLGRGGRRGKTATWLGKFLGVSAGEMILNPDEGEDVARAMLRVKPSPVVVKRQNALFDLYQEFAIRHGGEPDYDPDNDPEFVAKAHRLMGIGQ